MTKEAALFELAQMESKLMVAGCFLRELLKSWPNETCLLSPGALATILEEDVRIVTSFDNTAGLLSCRAVKWEDDDAAA